MGPICRPRSSPVKTQIGGSQLNEGLQPASYQLLSSPNLGADMISADLGAELESFVAKLVESGRYGSKSEVLREGVRLVEEREKRLALLDAALERGLAEVDTGRTHGLDDVLDELTRRYPSDASTA
jgi:antitoxin ParD1/3/4